MIVGATLTQHLFCLYICNTWILFLENMGGAGITHL